MSTQRPPCISAESGYKYSQKTVENGLPCLPLPVVRRWTMAIDITISGRSRIPTPWELWQYVVAPRVMPDFVHQQ